MFAKILEICCSALLPKMKVKYSFMGALMLLVIGLETVNWGGKYIYILLPVSFL